MAFLYWLTLVLGGGSFLLSLAGELFGAHGDFHHDVDVHAEDFDWGRLFSIRNLTYFLFAFGAVGVLLSWAWEGGSGLLVALVAALTGMAASAFSAMLFGYLRQSESGQRLTDTALIGRVGQITLPLVHGGTGKILITRGGQTQELLAQAMDNEGAPAEGWSSVVIVEMREGIAVVTPYSEEPQS